FQAEDGIRDFHVTGVQTCALPILALIVKGRGAEVEGSDRALDQGRNLDRFDFLRARGVRLHPQDGSGLTRPEQILVASGAVEERSEGHTSELQSRENLVCRLLLEK